MKYIEAMARGIAMARSDEKAKRMPETLRRGADCREDDDISGRGWSGATDAADLRELADRLDEMAADNTIMRVVSFLRGEWGVFSDEKNPAGYVSRLRDADRLDVLSSHG